MTRELRDILVDALVRQTILAVTTLPDDVKNAIRKAYEKESSPVAKKILGSIIDNYTMSEETGRPMCQDTGTLIWYVDAGIDFPLLLELKDIIREAARQATLKVPIRPNAVDPFRAKNSGDNTGRFMPWINWEIREGEDVILTLLPKGGGSEFTSQLKMISPGLGIKGVKEAVIKAVYEAGGKPCPPIIVGVGIGGGADIALKLGKMALLRPLDQKHEDPEVDELEEELFEKLNSLGIGPMGLGGDTTVLGVNVEYAFRHPATLPVAIVTQCWAARRATIRVSKDGKVEFLSHNIRLEDITIGGE